MAADKTTYHSSTIQRALDVLNLFKERHSLSFQEIQRKLGYNKSTLFRVLSVLQANRYLNRNEVGHYELGLNVFILGHSISKEYLLKKAALPHMKSLAQRIDLTVHLGILDATDVVIVAKAESDKRLRMLSRIGGSVPAHCTGQGKTLLAWTPRETVGRIINRHGLTRFTPNTICTADGLYAELDIIRERGYTLDNSEHERHIFCVAVPVLNADDQVMAALSVTGTVFDFPGEAAIQGTLELLRETRARIAGDLGYIDPV